MFNGADTSALLEINRHLVMSVATAGELLAHEGELAHEMHFMLSGEVHILDTKGGVDLELFEGAIIGEVSIFVFSLHRADPLKHLPDGCWTSRFASCLTCLLPSMLRLSTLPTSFHFLSTTSMTLPPSFQRS